jgi:hypothetical protein
VRIHWLTDGAYERSGLAPDNSQPIPGSQPVPLKSGQWNQLKLSLRGDEVQVIVNGTEVATQRLEPSNQRTFGLFRFADATGVKVRNVVHRGKWPLEPAPLSQQELAGAVR